MILYIPFIRLFIISQKISQKLICYAYDILLDILNRYNVYACDGTYSTLNIANKNGKASSFELSILLDISNNMISDYSFCFVCYAYSALKKTKLTENDIVILDRGYCTYDLMGHLYEKTNFILRIKSTISIAKRLIESKKNSIQLEHNNMKLICYAYSINHENNEVNNFDDEHKEGNENDSLYVLCTNMTNLTFEECLLKNMNIFFRRVI